MKRLAELMGGKAYAKSEVGVGSEFYFTAIFGIAPERENECEPRRLRGRRALVVDDSSTSVEILIKILEGWRVEAYGAMEGKMR